MEFNVQDLIDELAQQLQTLLDTGDVPAPALVGIHTGGAWVAQSLHERLALDMPFGSLNINFYRDDFSRRGMNPVVNTSQIEFPVENRDILLVDDVLYTGRTIRAAMNEIFDYGRPASLRLLVLVDRGGRELPIAPDIAGLQLDLAPNQHVELHGPDPLRLEVLTP